MIGFLAVVLGATGFYLSLPGAIRVQSDPPGAEVLIDGEVRGTTAEDAPLRIELEAGSHEIRFRKEGYLELKERGLMGESWKRRYITWNPAERMLMGLRVRENEGGLCFPLRCCVTGVTTTVVALC